jgi:ABC-type amino acid transport substrate-binding protein
MKPNKILFILLALNILSLAFTEAGTAGTFQDVKKRGKLIAGVRRDSPPFGFVDRDGVHKGFDIDLAKTFARELFGKEEALELVDVTPANRIPFLKKGKVDVLIANMTITDSRKKVIDFSNPYFLSGHLILVRKDSNVTRYQDLAGKKIATLRKSIGYTAVKKLVPTAELVQFEKNPDAIKALKEGRVDAFVQDYLVIYDLQNQNRDLKIAGLPPFVSAPFGIGVRKGDLEWLNFVNATLNKIKESGEYHQLLEKWFGTTIALLQSGQ